VVDQRIPKTQSSVTRTNPKKTTDTIAKATRFFSAALLSISTLLITLWLVPGDVNNYMDYRQEIFPEASREKEFREVFERERDAITF
jgi:hypothetical protein